MSGVGREASVERQTGETRVRVRFGLDTGPAGNSATGLAALDHLLDQLRKHGRFTLEVEARGDLEIDPHHLVEDVGITIGQALHRALGDRAGIERYASPTVPMDEALVQVIVDVSGRALLVYDPAPVGGGVGAVTGYHVREFLRGLAGAAGLTMHVRMLSIGDPHHTVECTFKAVARALREAVRLTGEGVPSTKGRL